MSSIGDFANMQRQLNLSNDTPTTKERIPGYIYILHIREFVNQNVDIYKIGRTDDIIRRFEEYPKGTVIKYCVFVHDTVLFEREIIKQFKDKFMQRRYLGLEFFEGDLNSMGVVIQDYVFECSPKNTTEIVKPIIKKLNASVAVMEYVETSRSNLFKSEDVFVRSKVFYNDFLAWLMTNNYESNVSLTKMAAVLRNSYKVVQDIQDFDDSRDQVFKFPKLKR